MRRSVIDILNDLLILHHRSLPTYLVQSVPWTPDDDPDSQAARRVLDNIVSDHEQYARRFAEAITARGGQPELGGYPMQYTDLHLLSLDYFLRELRRTCDEVIAKLDEAAADLAADPSARELAEEALGSAQAHQEALEECCRRKITIVP